MTNDLNKNMLVQFEDFEIRRIWDDTEGKWYFSVIDIVSILSDSKNPRVYWSQVKRREKQTSGQLFTFCKQFKLKAVDGKMRNTDCADVEGVFRIIQSIPSPHAEPFKQWLATIGRERLEEIENPELIAERFRVEYRQKGYSEEWIEARMRGINIRKELTDEWHQRGVQEGKEYAFLTAEISRGTFGINPTEHKDHKALKKKHNLRDHMSNAELVFTMLGELTTTEVARKDDAQGFDENQDAAQKGGKVAGDARQNFEETTGKPVLSSRNYLDQPESQQSLVDDNEDNPVE